ncbi:MAG: SMC-Scp complex subunit ScpB [Pirellulaceae bacterium]
MRSRSPKPAIQLRSVAGRYRIDNAHRPGRHRMRWGKRSPDTQSGGPESPPLAGLSAEDLDSRIYQLEGILFIAREPISSRKLSEMAGLADGTEARTLIRYLNERYDQQQRAIRLEQVAGGYQLMTRPEYASWLRTMNHIPAAIRLSQPALETLAVVAYQQPVMRVEVEAIRGVACGEVLRHLMERGLVRIAGRGEELGRPYLYGTTKDFLEAFGMADIEEMPPMDRRQPLSPSA